MKRMNIFVEKDDNVHFNDVQKFMDNENTFEGVLSSDIFPWYRVSKYFPDKVNKCARFVGDSIQRLYYIAYPIVAVFMAFIRFRMLRTTYTHSYQETHCDTYYTFNFSTFTHHPITRNATNLTSFEITRNATNLTTCENSPLYFLGFVFSEFIKNLICVVWFYSMDRRYGVLKLISESSTAKLRKQNTCAQLLCILGMVPVNLFLAVIFTYFLMPLLVAMAILIWNCPCHCLDRITKKFICDQQILFLYLLVTMQDVSSVSGSCILTFIDLACSENTQVLKFTNR